MSMDFDRYYEELAKDITANIRGEKVNMPNVAEALLISSAIRAGLADIAQAIRDKSVLGRSR